MLWLAKILFMGSVTLRTYGTTAKLKPAVDTSSTEVSSEEVTGLQQLKLILFSGFVADRAFYCFPLFPHER